LRQNWPNESDFLRNQTAATVYMLAAVIYLGRGDFDDFDLLDRYTQMSETFAKVEYAVQQIAMKTPLPRYLQNRFDILTKAGIDIDEFMGSRRGKNGYSVLCRRFFRKKYAVPNGIKIAVKPGVYYS
jgi:hypothetical protein